MCSRREIYKEVSKKLRWIEGIQKILVLLGNFSVIMKNTRINWYLIYLILFKISGGFFRDTLHKLKSLSKG